MFTSSFRYIRFCSCHGQGKQKQSTKHTKKNQTKAGHERGPNEVPNEVKNYPGQTLTQMFESWPMLIDKEPRKKKEHRMAHTHPRAKTTYMTNPKCLNVIHQNISLYILFHAILSYLNLTNPHKHICCEKKATHGRHTSKHRNNIHNLSNMLYYDARQYAFPQGRRSSATT